MSARPVADVIEDLEFLDSTGVGATEAARRTDFPSAHAMEKWLERHGRVDLWLSLKRRDPADTHLSGSERKQARLMPVPNSIDTIAAVLAEADKSTRARTRNRADKVRALVEELRSTLAAEREADRQREAARKEVERLERQLADAKARLRGGSTTPVVVGDFTCECGRTFSRSQGLSRHRNNCDAATEEQAS